MAITFNETTIAAEPFGVHAKRQRLLTEARVKGTRILLDRLTLGAGAVIELDVPAGSLAWFRRHRGRARAQCAFSGGKVTEPCFNEHAAHFILSCALM